MSEFLCNEYHVKVYFIVVFIDSNHYVCNKFLLMLNARGKNPPMPFSLYNGKSNRACYVSPACLNPGTLQAKLKDQLSSLLLVKNFSYNIFSSFFLLFMCCFVLYPYFTKKINLSCLIYLFKENRK